MNTVLVQTFSAATGQEMQEVFSWDIGQEKYNPSIVSVTSAQVIVAYEVRTSTGKKIRMIRLRVVTDGTVTAMGSSHLVSDDGEKPRVQKTSAGGSLVSYSKNDKTFVKTYDSANRLIIGPFLVGGGDDIAFLNDGRIAVTWESDNKIYFQLYDSVTGHSKTAALKVDNSVTTSLQMYPAIMSLSAGGFMVTWQQKNTGSADYDVMACEFTGAGQKVSGSPFIANEQKTAGEQTRPTLAEIDSGAVLFAWNHQNADMSQARKVQYQIFDMVVTGSAVSRHQQLSA
jgi:hypothetical protein